MKRIALILLVLAPLLGLSPANASTYDVNFSIGNFPATVVTGTIVTTCDSCLLPYPL